MFRLNKGGADEEIGIEGYRDRFACGGGRPKLWAKVDTSEFDIIYITPEIALDPAGHFYKTSHKNTKFKCNLALVAIDECYLIWEWVGFRKKFELIGSLRMILSITLCAVLSATLIPNVAGYIHTAVGLKFPTVRYNLNTRCNNINLIMKSTDGKHFDDLYNRLPSAKDTQQIPKTIVFHDNIDR